MKKILSFVLCSLMIMSLATSVFAFTAEDWVKGNGYDVVKKVEDKNTVVEKNTPVTVTGNDDGTVTVSHGGYYQNGENWGGVASKEKYDLEGLSVTVRFDQVPDVIASDDCWMHIGVSAKPEIFKVGDITGNRTFINLLRFGKGVWETRNGIENFNRVENLDDYDTFTVVSGDTVNLYFKKNAEGTYNVVLTKNNMYYTTQKTYDLAKISEDGKVHVVVSASLFASEKDAFKYTITKIENLPVDPYDKYLTEDPEKGAVKVYVDGERMSFADVQPTLTANGKTAVIPLRAVFEKLGYEVSWDHATKTVYAKKDGDEIKVKIGDKKVFKNNERFGSLEQAAEIVDGRTMVPATAVRDICGEMVRWFPETTSVVITNV